MPTLAAVRNRLRDPQQHRQGDCDSARAYGHVVNSGRAYLGVEPATAASAVVVVTRVVAGGPARRAGIGAGDVIVSIEGRPVQSIDDIASVLADLRPGTTAKIDIRTPAGTSRSVSVKLGESPGA